MLLLFLLFSRIKLVEMTYIKMSEHELCVTALARSALFQVWIHLQ